MTVAQILAIAVKLAPEELDLLERGIVAIRTAWAGGETEAQAVARARAVMESAVDLEEDMESPKGPAR